MGVTVPWVNTTYDELTSTTLGLAKLGDATVRTISGKVYGVAKNANGQLCVNVPWTDTVPTAADMGLATATNKGVVKLGSDTQVTQAVNAATVGTAGRVYPVQQTATNQLVVNVPWIDTVPTSADIARASATNQGVVKLGSDTVQNVAANTPSVTAGRTYAIQYNASNQLVVNVPWTDNNTTYNNVTTTAAGLMSAADKTKLDGIAEGANNYTLPAATDSVRGGVKTGYTTNGRNYAVQVADEKMYVNVPWTDTNTTYNNATTTVAGLMSAADKTKLDGITAGANNYTLPVATSSTRGGAKIGYTSNGKNYAVQIDENEKMYVQVPWENDNTTYSNATQTTAGLMSAADKIKLDGIAAGAGSGSYTLPVATSDSLGGVRIGYTTSGSNYAVQLDSNNKMYVNVPVTSGTDGSKIYQGTALNNTTGSVFTITTGIGKTDDMYINTTTYDIYHCESADGKKWKWTGNIKGADGTGGSGTSAGFGTPVASYEGNDDTKNDGNPYVEVTASGPNTAKVFTFKFWNLGNSGSGTPAATYTPVFLTVS